MQLNVKTQESTLSLKTNKQQIHDSTGIMKIKFNYVIVMKFREVTKNPLIVQLKSVNVTMCKL